jgi:hypothetical protein
MNRRRRLSAGEQGVTDRQHRVAIASVAAVLLGITVVLALRDPGPASGMRRVRSDRKARRFEQRLRPRPSRRSRAVRGTPFPSSAPSRSPNSAPPVTKLEREPKKAPRSRPREARAATAAARAFLDGYLPYSYGQSDAGPIRAAAWRLLRELEASPPRVPAAVARARPRLISVRAEAATGDLDVDVLAVVDDGQRRYSFRLLARKAERRWIVAAVSG